MTSARDARFQGSDRLAEVLPVLASLPLLRSSASSTGTTGASTTGCCTFQPRDFFLAFGGIVCVVFDGFPRPVEDFKALLNVEAARLPSVDAENMGSKWAKLSLGASRKPSHRFTRQEVEVIRETCLEYRERLRHSTMTVRSLSAVDFFNRALSSRRRVVRFPIADGTVSGGGASAVSDAMRAKTDSVVAPFFAMDDDICNGYVADLSRNPSYATVYLEPNPGSTLVCEAFTEWPSDPSSFADVNSQSLPCPPDSSSHTSMNAQLLEVVRQFRAALDERLLRLASQPQSDSLQPSVEGSENRLQFEWFPDDALHCTVRGLN